MKTLAFLSSQWRLRTVLTRKCWTVRNSNEHSTCKRTRTTSSSVPVSCNSVKQAAKQRRPVRLICVGDIHGQWDEEDEMALRSLKPDVALFVGDYGDEDVRITRRIADLADDVSFAVGTVFGNHDAFFTASNGGCRRAPYDKSTTCRVSDQIEMLRCYDVSYRSVSFDNIPFSVCGGRSFSAGGPYWKYKTFFRDFVGVFNLKHSINKMIQAVMTAENDGVVFLSHNGPTELGDKPWDPCGKDWGEVPGGDFGDADLRVAIEEARNLGKRVPLVVFGHMHKTLFKGSGNRTMVKTEPDRNTGFETLMLNTAIFPRHTVDPVTRRSLRNFHLVQIGEGGYVDFAEEIWVTSDGKIRESTSLYSGLAMSGSSSAAAVEVHAETR
ncbi:hypothetical protein BWQ96_02128 [Gracilariopsis chorda]|uniref:Calcineurin-like phosphoesterase domain-containing protein n=1 Tax=Gracilariopsis chorda TaxID=448386 RepID=A0A2V3J193_9FLOR|nr:hypothetical protein BWQ96_02128 [Gracilariopsis chorda]|eukprot:PXF48176.1 hypothetical protein BWQ96_02128 [Gracilariopsis chorda]